MKKIVKEIEFNDKGTFMAWYAATKWASDNGYSCGSMCAPQPTALFKVDALVAKWRNLSKKERESADGIILPVYGCYREGPLKIIIYEKETTQD